MMLVDISAGVAPTSDATIQDARDRTIVAIAVLRELAAGQELAP